MHLMIAKHRVLVYRYGSFEAALRMFNRGDAVFSNADNNGYYLVSGKKAAALMRRAGYAEMEMEPPGQY